MKFDVLTLFPGMFSGPFDDSIIKRACERGLVDISVHNIRDYADGRHQVTDDSPYGGGAGMVMKPDPICSCIDEVKKQSPGSRVVVATPQGTPFTHERAQEFSRLPGVIVVCGRYEGIDERVITLYSDYEVSLGDFVMTGGEIAAMAIVDAVTRLVAGVLGSEESAAADSFCEGLLEYPHYTRPPEYRGLKVPEVLLSGNHSEIRKWRRRESLRKTLETRPDLLSTAHLTKEDCRFLCSMGYDAAV